MKYQISKNKKSEYEIVNLKSQKEALEIEDKYIKERSTKLENLILEMKNKYDNGLEDILKKHNEEVYNKNKLIEELRYKLDFMDKNPMLNEVIKKVILKILKRIKKHFSKVKGNNV